MPLCIAIPYIDPTLCHGATCVRKPTLTFNLVSQPSPARALLRRTESRKRGTSFVSAGTHKRGLCTSFSPGLNLTERLYDSDPMNEMKQREPSAFVFAQKKRERKGIL